MHSHPPSSTQRSRPFLKWAGGKQRLLKQLLPLLPTGNRLIEPFVGAGSVFLGTDYPSHVLNDANPDLASVWVCLKDRPSQFCTRACRHFTEENRAKDAFLKLREHFNRTSDSYERATLLPYLNRFGFNGLYRVNSRGMLNTPYGHPTKVPAFGHSLMLAASKKLQRAEVMCGDFSAAIELATEGDVVYCDPPYSDLEGALVRRLYDRPLRSRPARPLGRRLRSSRPARRNSADFQPRHAGDATTLLRLGTAQAGGQA